MAHGQDDDTAPHIVVSAGRPPNGKRLRRRGPRSWDAVTRRCAHSGSALNSCKSAEAPFHTDSLISAVSPPPVDSLHGKSGAESSFNWCSLLGLSCVLLHVQSIISNEKRAMLSAHVELFKPDILVLNETWLDGSVASLVLANYSLVSRRDRPNSKVGKLNHCGVAVYSRVGSMLVPT